MRSLPVTAKGLRKRSVAIGQTTIDDASLFPFFERAGQVKMLMLVNEYTSEIVFLDLKPGTAKARPWLPVRLNVAQAAAFEPATPEVIDRACRLWHFDPWWVLGEPRYAGHWAVPHLKQTNIVGKVSRGVGAVAFRGDLTRVSMFTYDKNNGEYQRWKPEVLPADHPPALPAAARKSRAERVKGWRLAPIWQGKLKR